MRLDRKVAVVTGASRGIGREIALAFAREGARVAIGYSVRADAAHAVATEIEAAGGIACPVGMDERGARELVDKVLDIA